MPVVSIVTPVFGASVNYLTEAHHSLLAQDLPAGWDWEWLVQEDGDGGTVRDRLPDDPRIRFGAARHGGPHVARTMALARARGPLVKNLDADDVLPPGTLARDIHTLTADPDVAWTTSRVLDLLPDGSTVGFDADPPQGRIERGAVIAHWKRHDHRPQVHPATLCLRTELVLALGGWMALPASGDTGLLLAANAVSTGYFHAEVGLLYRKWPGQHTAHVAHSHHERDERIGVIERRADAMLATGWHFQSSAQPAG
ncbi:glycosyltransferase family 2 protein [Streptacidiphilus monticola]|uniref:Glycosyltransferase family 2 protein n=1 Tax=Streptacidiphilus monticola TaxID=2161674 RepID=A0ABW1GAL6_9ACTN